MNSKSNNHSAEKNVVNMLETRGSEVELLYNISKILSTGIDRKAIAVIIELIEMGIDAESIADGN